MNIKIGEKIRQLRQRDERTQDDLACALGVSPQAVSRWEANGGYPDMELMPAIANYFHISIDELFGYHDDREEKINAILDSATEILTKEGFTMSQGSLSDDVEKCIKMLRDAAEEFPNEPKILLKLAQALQMWGYSKYGAKGIVFDNSGVIEYDTEYNLQNIYWREAVTVYEKLLKANPSSEERTTAICQLTPLYCKMGEHEKAKSLANAQSPLIISREVLLPQATTGKERIKYQGERLTTLLSSLSFAVSEPIAIRPAISSSEYGKKLLMSVINMYETIFADGRCGKYHADIGQLYLTIATYEDNRSESCENVISYFDKGFEHIAAYARICKEDEYRYSAPLVSGLPSLRGNELAPLDDDFWKKNLRHYRRDVTDKIKKSEKYSVCFK